MPYGPRLVPTLSAAHNIRNDHVLNAVRWARLIRFALLAEHACALTPLVLTATIVYETLRKHKLDIPLCLPTISLDVSGIKVSSLNRDQEDSGTQPGSDELYPRPRRHIHSRRRWRGWLGTLQPSLLWRRSAHSRIGTRDYRRELARMREGGRLVFVGGREMRHVVAHPAISGICALGDMASLTFS